MADGLKAGQSGCLMISPVYNEDKFIERMIDSVVAQSIRPSKWIIVNDGSTDRTSEIIESYRGKYNFIEHLILPRREQRLPGGEAAIEYALKQVVLTNYEFLARFDADIVLEHEYFYRILAEFARDERLGIAGGDLCLEKDGGLISERCPQYHVRGPIKMYRVQCFLEIGGLKPYIGWDTIDEGSAWAKGWKTRTFPQAKAIHQRSTGSAIPAGKIYWERGRAEYFSWSHPLFVFLKTPLVAIHNCSAVAAVSFLMGFLSCYVSRPERIQDPQFRKVRRQQQFHRIWTFDVNGKKNFVRTSEQP
jgi:poly-beta-1,6-N-acetyl-D-glucosamine synthase